MKTVTIEIDESQVSQLMALAHQLNEAAKPKKLKPLTAVVNGNTLTKMDGIIMYAWASFQKTLNASPLLTIT